MIQQLGDEDTNTPLSKEFRSFRVTAELQVTIKTCTREVKRGTHKETKDHRAEVTPDETFPRLLW